MTLTKWKKSHHDFEYHSSVIVMTMTFSCGKINNFLVISQLYSLTRQKKFCVISCGKIIQNLLPLPPLKLCSFVSKLLLFQSTNQAPPQKPQFQFSILILCSIHLFVINLSVSSNPLTKFSFSFRFKILKDKENILHIQKNGRTNSNTRQYHCRRSTY